MTQQTLNATFCIGKRLVHAVASKRENEVNQWRLRYDVELQVACRQRARCSGGDHFAHTATAAHSVWLLVTRSQGFRLYVRRWVTTTLNSSDRPETRLDRRGGKELPPPWPTQPRAPLPSRRDAPQLEKLAASFSSSRIAFFPLCIRSGHLGFAQDSGPVASIAPNTFLSGISKPFVLGLLAPVVSSVVKSSVEILGSRTAALRERAGPMRILSLRATGNLAFQTSSFWLT